MNEAAILRNRISAMQFASWELHLFLDTHPDNAEALAKQRDYSEKTSALIAEYEANYGPLRTSDHMVDRWSWVNDPWPWETEGNE